MHILCKLRDFSEMHETYDVHFKICRAILDKAFKYVKNVVCGEERCSDMKYIAFME